MIKTYPGLVHLNGNLLAAIDLETTGRRAGWHEILQIAIVPLDSEIRPLDSVKPFYWNVKPDHPERQEQQAGHVHGLSINDLVLHAAESGRVKDRLFEWFEKLQLPFEKNLTPLAHNFPFESSFLKAWLGVDDFDRLFHFHPRDAMTYALALNDKAAFKGEKVPFNRVGLESLCRKFGIVNEHPHDALNDCLAEAEVYRALLHFDTT